MSHVCWGRLTWSVTTVTFLITDLYLKGRPDAQGQSLNQQDLTLFPYILQNQNYFHPLLEVKVTIHINPHRATATYN